MQKRVGKWNKNVICTFVRWQNGNGTQKGGRGVKRKTCHIMCVCVEHFVHSSILFETASCRHDLFKDLNAVVFLRTSHVLLCKNE